MGPTVQIQASAKNRSLVKAATARRRVIVRVELLFWRHLVSKAVYDAKKTRDGLPTDAALMARHWIEKDRPPQSDRLAWETSFEACCSWLDLNPETERKRLVAEIEAALLQACVEHVRKYSYTRSAAVLSCAGIRTAVNRTLVLPLVSEQDYAEVAGIDPAEHSHNGQLDLLGAA